VVTSVWQATPVVVYVITQRMVIGDLLVNTLAQLEPELQVCQQRFGLGVILGLELQALGVEARQVWKDAGLQRHSKDSRRHFMLAGDLIWPAISV
jgi:hypothetical protein